MIISKLTPKKGSFFTRLEVKKCVEHNNIINPLMNINKLEGVPSVYARRLPDSYDFRNIFAYG